MNVERLIKEALREDIQKGDMTTKILFPEPVRIRAAIVAKESGVVCGINVVEEIFKAAKNGIRKNKEKEGKIRGKKGKREIRVYKKVKDGAIIKKGQVVCCIEGDARVVLAAERTALNFLGRLSGIATLTRQYVDRVKPYKTKVLDTRKTTPLLRSLEKYAVKTGGGYNHRMGLWDMVLVKDNHIAVVSSEKRGVRGKADPGDIIYKMRNKIKKGVKIEIEVENINEFRKALKAKPDIIMLDNMSIAEIKRAVKLRNSFSSSLTTHPSLLLEVSGGVTLNNIRAVAATGADLISVGGLTHSAKSIDFSMEV